MGSIAHQNDGRQRGQLSGSTHSFTVATVTAPRSKLVIVEMMRAAGSMVTPVADFTGTSVTQASQPTLTSSATRAEISPRSTATCVRSAHGSAVVNRSLSKTSRLRCSGPSSTNESSPRCLDQWTEQTGDRRQVARVANLGQHSRCRPERFESAGLIELGYLGEVGEFGERLIEVGNLDPGEQRAEVRRPTGGPIGVRRPAVPVGVDIAAVQRDHLPREPETTVILGGGSVDRGVQTEPCGQLRHGDTSSPGPSRCLF